MADVTSRARSDTILVLREFLSGRPENTRRAYQRAVRDFFELWKWKAPELMTVAEAAYFKRWLRSRDLRDSTIYQRLAACQSFFDFLMQTGRGGETNPFRLVSRKDCTPTPYDRSAPTEWSDFEKILKAIPDDAAGKRDKALIIFLASTGRRRTEVAGLRVRDLNLTASPRTYTAKVKGRDQVFELSDACHEAIVDHWVSSNRLATLTANSAVFGPISPPGRKGTRDPHRCLTLNQLALILKRNAQRAGLDPRRYKLHSIRHMADPRLQDVRSSERTASGALYAGKIRGPANSRVQKQLDAVRRKAAEEAAAAIM
jgi:site-specific recombinase XerD